MTVSPVDSEKGIEMSEVRHAVASAPDPVQGLTPDQLTGLRRGTHGKWASQSATEQRLKDILRAGPAWPDMTASQRAAAEMIAVKLSRIVNGNPHYADHWQDIGGYALLGETGDHAAPAGDVIGSWLGHTH